MLGSRGLLRNGGETPKNTRSSLRSTGPRFDGEMKRMRCSRKARRRTSPLPRAGPTPLSSSRAKPFPIMLLSAGRRDFEVSERDWSSRTRNSAVGSEEDAVRFQICSTSSPCNREWKSWSGIDTVWISFRITGARSLSDVVRRFSSPTRT